MNLIHISNLIYLLPNRKIATIIKFSVTKIYINYKYKKFHIYTCYNVKEKIIKYTRNQMVHLCSHYLRKIKLIIRKTCMKTCHQRTFIPDLCGKVGVIGVPFGKGQISRGLKEEGLVRAPDIIRSTGFMDDLSCLGLNVYDYGNVHYTSNGSEICYDNMANLNHVTACCKEVFSHVRKVLSDARICLTLGGDHSIAAGTISGHMSFTGPDDVAVIYVDAHADLNTNCTSETGSIHGMHLALLVNELACHWPGPVPGFDWLRPSLSVKDIAYIGLRSVDPWESFFITQNNICAFSMEDVQNFGCNVVIRKVLECIDPNHEKSIHLSFDIDSLDYFEAPCTTVPVRGGLSLREALNIVETVHRTKRLAVVDIVEVNPLLGNDFQQKVTLDATKHLILGMFGRSRKGNPIN